MPTALLEDIVEQPAGVASLTDIVDAGPAVISPPGEIERQQAWSLSPKRDAAAARAHQPAVNTPTLLDRAKGWWDRLTAPLVPQIATGTAALADIIDTPTLQPAPTESGRALALTGRTPTPAEIASGPGFAAGAVRGAGEVAASLTSPANVAMTVAGAGEAIPAVKAIPTLRRGLRGIEMAGGGAFAAEGAHRVLTEPTIAGKAMGATELAAGAVGAHAGVREGVATARDLVARTAEDARGARAAADAAVARGEALPAEPIPPPMKNVTPGVAPIADIVAVVKEGDHAVPEQISNESRVRGVPGPGDEAQGAAVGGRNAEPEGPAGAQSQTEALAPAVPQEGVGASSVDLKVNTAPLTDIVAVAASQPVEHAPIAPIPPTVTLEPSNHAEVQTGDAGTRDVAPTPGPAAEPGGGYGPQGGRLSKVRQREQDLLTRLTQEAVARGHTGDPEQLYAHLQERADAMREIKAEVEAAGGTPNALLREIVKAGGISLKNESAQKGEIRWLKESPLSKRWGLFSGRRGLSLDGAVEALRQDPRFQHIETVNDLVDELSSIAHGEIEQFGELTAKELGAHGDRWWEKLLPPDKTLHNPHAATVADWSDHELHQALEEHLQYGRDAALSSEDNALYLKALESELANRAKQTAHVNDILDTGEAQPRLPEAGQVRESETKTPEFEAPFSLEAEAHDAGSVQKGFFDKGTTLDAAIIPGMRQFVEQDVTPTVKAAAEDVQAAKEDLRALFAPDTIGHPARTFAGIMRANLAAHSQRIQRAHRSLRRLEQAFDRRSNDQNVAFVDAIELGDIDTLPADERAAAARLRELLDEKRKQVQARGKLQQYIRNYFPHEWAEPGAVKKMLNRLMGKKPLQGSKSFLKKRSIPTMKEGLEAGLEPVSYNPVTLTLRKLIEMDKFLMGTDVLEDAKQYGVAKFVPIGADHPDGWQRYHESFGTVYAPPTVQVHEAFDAKLMEKLHSFAESLGVKTVRKVKIGGTRWGYAVGDSQVVSKFAGPETVLMHELGHILDERYGLKDQWVKDRSMKLELRELADLRHEGKSREEIPDSFHRYVRKGEEKIANLVHAFIWNPERTKQIAPQAYAAVSNLIKKHPELEPLRELQKTRSLVLTSDTKEARIPGMVISGHYYGPPDAVRLLNNHLSPGLRRNAAFNLYRRMGNALNQVQLGLSAFHLTMTGLEAVVSKGAQALQELSRGEIRHGLSTAAKTPFATFLDLFEGHKALKEFYKTDANAKQFASITDQIIQGGGGFGWDLFHHDGAPDAFMKALRQGNLPGAAFRTLPAIFELSAKPVMEWWVPRLKAGAYLDLARMELRTLGPEPDLEEVRKVLGAAWDSIDNRFGELRYDNLFWHAATKDLGMASVRALGWNVGTVREVGGAPSELAKQLVHRPTRRVNVGKDAETGIPKYADVKAPWLSNKPAYTVSMVMLIGMAGAIYQYLHTGERPSELKDYFFPKTGGTLPNGTPERASLPSYMKDVYAYSHAMPGSIAETAKHKLNPILNVLADMWSNQDYFGTEIRNPDDPLVQQGKDVAKYLADAFMPISVRSYQRRREDSLKPGERGIGATESFFGITPAPASVTRSQAETLMRGFEAPAMRTRDQAAAADLRRQIREGLRAGTPAGREQAADAARSGDLSRRQILNAVRTSRATGLQAGFQRLTLDQALRVYDVATEDERAALHELLMTKLGRIGQAPPNDQADLMKRGQAAGALPYTGKRASPIPSLRRAQ